MEKGDQTELKCIFNLFDPGNTGKIEIGQINKINRELNSLNATFQKKKKEERKNLIIQSNC